MNWDIQVNEEVDLLRETVRQFAEKNIAPIADDIDRDNEFPQHLWTELGKLGLLGITVSEDYGCLLYTSPSPRDKRQSRMPSSA